MEKWILGMTGASLLSCLALTLCPEGRVKSVTRLVCGAVCVLALIKPLGEADLSVLSVGLAQYRQAALSVTQDAEEQALLLQRTYIQDECAAYIQAQAQKLGLSVSGVTVTAVWNGEQAVWTPESAAVGAAYDAALSRIIEGELGVPPERQEWNGNDG